MKINEMPDKKIKNLCMVLAGLLLLLAFLIVIRYFVNHPSSIQEEDNKFDLGRYDLQEEGLLPMNDIFAMAKDLPESYEVAYFSITADHTGQVKSFTIALNTYDDNGAYKGSASFVYDGESKDLSYRAPRIDRWSRLTVPKNTPNSTVEYLNKQIKKIPLKEQMAVTAMDTCIISYEQYTLIDEGTPIFDGRQNEDFTVLTKEEYNEGKGGISDGKTSVVFDLYDGVDLSEEEAQHYLYVCVPADEKTAVGNQNQFMEGDYYINNGVLKITRDFGQSWIESDITAEELSETMELYQTSLAFIPESIFISSEETLPIAFFYGEKPRIKILPPKARTWKTVQIPTEDDFGRSITRRAIGFTSESFGYAALGTDWSMGAGESKKCYLTFDGGSTWIKKGLPMECTSRTLIDFCMADEETGVLTLSDGINADFPLVFVTEDGADKWTQIELPFEDLPEGYYLMDIIKLEYTRGQFFLTLGQENEGTKKAVFVTDNLTQGWKLSKTYKSVIHTVG